MSNIICLPNIIWRLKTPFRVLKQNLNFTCLGCEWIMSTGHAVDGTGSILELHLKKRVENQSGGKDIKLYSETCIVHPTVGEVLLKRCEFNYKDDAVCTIWSETSGILKRLYEISDDIIIRIIFKSTASIIQLFPAKDTENAVFERCSYTERLCSDISSLFNDEKSADITVICQDKKWHGHKAILMARCGKFARELSAEKRSYYATDITPGICDLMLKFVYSSKLDPINQSEAAELFLAADIYECENLKSICAPFIGKDPLIKMEIQPTDETHPPQSILLKMLQE